MKICWDNLENLKYSKRTDRWYMRYPKGAYEYFKYMNECEYCKNPFLGSTKKKNNFCSNECCTSKPRNKEYRKKLSIIASERFGPKNSNFDNKWTEKQKRQMSIKKKGQGLGNKRPDHSLKMCGNGNPNWKGGVSYEPYCQVWKDKEYKYSIRERDGNQCKNPLCEKKSEKICIHHVNYDKKNCIPSNLITLCFSCNARANFNRNFWQKHYKKIIQNSVTT